MDNMYTDFTGQLLYEMVQEHDKDNIVVSPYSVISLLAMSAQATSAGTRNEIINALITDGTYEDLASSISEVISKISGENGICSSNATLVRNVIGESIQEGYAEALKTAFDGDLLISDDLVASANKWVSEKTQGMIPQIMDKTDSLACLINAILFKADWQEEYDLCDIKENSKFTNSDDTISHVTMLHSSEDDYVENAYFTGFAKPYKNGFSYMALFP